MISKSNLFMPILLLLLLVVRSVLYEFFYCYPHTNRASMSVLAAFQQHHGERGDGGGNKMFPWNRINDELAMQKVKINRGKTIN